MAKLPPIRRIFREDLGADVPQWVTRLLAPLNLVLEAVYQALNKQLDFGVNIRSQTREFTIVGGINASDNTYNFPVELGGMKPVGLWVISAARLDGTVQTFTDAVFASWSWNSQLDEVAISGITGLANGVSYRIRIILI